MWKKMLFTFTGLACVLTLPALATEPQGLTIAPGGCVLDWVEIRGKLVLDTLPDDSWWDHRHPELPRPAIARIRLAWRIHGNGTVYELNFGSKQAAADLAARLKDRWVIVSGLADGGILHVSGLREDTSYVHKAVQVEIKGKLEVDLTEILRPFSVSYYVTVEGQRYYLDFTTTKDLEQLAGKVSGTVIVTGTLETHGRWEIVHVTGLRTDPQSPLP
jgi:hypothetical protein